MARSEAARAARRAAEREIAERHGYGSYYEYRNARAQDAGFSGYTEQRRMRREVDPERNLPVDVRDDVARFARESANVDGRTKSEIIEDLERRGFFDYSSEDDLYTVIRAAYRRKGRR